MRIFLAVPFRQLDDFKGDRGDSGADHVEFAGGALFGTRKELGEKARAFDGFFE